MSKWVVGVKFSSSVLIATAIEPDAIPEYVLDDAAKASAVKSVVQDEKKHFSLAGVQMKFSMREKDGRYQIAESGALGDWIIKTPSTTRAFAGTPPPGPYLSHPALLVG